MPNINVAETTKTELDSLKVHPRESYDEVVMRLVKDKKESKVGI